ncbi:MAG: ribonuclease E, partial [Methylophagaceae bacterium]
ESNIIIRALRDYLRKDIGEILVDSPEVYQTGYDFMRMVMPHELNKFKLYQDKVPLFTRYQIESQIETAFRHEVRLPSGGALVIDPTEALISIDVNSARANKGGDIEETAFNTNLEAAEEIARQLRLRDLGGLVVIDFIDMGPSRHQREVENRLRDHLKVDRARVQVGRISRFGLLEMSRQRIRPSLGDAHEEVCPRCSGLGHVRGVESLGLAVLRLIEEEASRDGISQLVVQLPVSVATFMLNEKRFQLEAVERRHTVKLLLIPNPHMDTPHYEIERVKDGSEKNEVSHHLMDTPAPEVPDALKVRPTVEQPAVTGVSPAAPAPSPSIVTTPVAAVVAAVAEVKKMSLLSRLLNVITGKAPEPEVEVVEEKNAIEKSATPAAEDKPQREQNKRPRNRNNRRQPRRGDEEGKNETKDQPKDESKDEVQAPPVKSDPVPKEDDDQSQGRNNNSRRSRRGGRRRRPRQDNDVEQQIPDDKGNRLAPVKKEVDGNALPVDDKPLPDGNVIQVDAVKEVDGNKPASHDKPARKQSSTPRRRRTPPKEQLSPKPQPESKPKTRVEEAMEANVVSNLAKPDASSDSGEPKPKPAPRKRARRKVKPKEDATEE